MIPFKRKLRVLAKKMIRTVYPNFKTGVYKGNAKPAEYAYSVFMRHLVKLHEYGMKKIPNRIAEFGPGNSLGVGLCALLAGTNEYYALDLVKYKNMEENMPILEDLIRLFKSKRDIPSESEFPEIRPLLDSYSFPSHILTADYLTGSLSDERITRIKKLLAGNGGGGTGSIVIKYIVPWEDYPENELPQVDCVVSQAVLEHVDNLPGFYTVLSKIVTPGGYTSHQIDFSSHKLTVEWNGQWRITEKEWHWMREGDTYLINREPMSTHLKLLVDNGFEIKTIQTRIGEENLSIQRKELVERFKNITEDDFKTRGCFVAAVKTG